MSLSDHLRYLRAMAGGPDTRSIAEAIGLQSLNPITAAETRYRPVEDATLIGKLADYYGRSPAEFHWHNERPRKFLTFSLEAALRARQPISLTLRTGETLTGMVAWWDLGAVGLEVENGRLCVIQRHAVIDWPDATDWENV